MNTTLHLIRHAEVEPAYQGVFGGTIDMNLSPRGEQQARALADYLQQRPLDVLFASPMKRVQQTLAPLVERSTQRPVVLPDLHEVNFGAWQGLNFAQVKARYGYDSHQWLEALVAGKVPQAEGMDAYRLRIAGCLRKILDQGRGRSVGVFCHGGVIRMLISLLLRLPYEQMDWMEIEYASISTVTLDGSRARLRLSDFAPWRDLPGLNHAANHA
ncbi:MAG TPA: histidine phosphatase family protein [Verrucomicrobiota bacterium]|nr:histidine phosphatase family protein [Verrucomicrobiota bacterium]HNT16218.1 histidine phosphatase family protein [Verrucomicrobiota bacterium]